VYNQLFVPGWRNERAYKALSLTCKQLHGEVQVEGPKILCKYYKDLEKQWNSSHNPPIHIEGTRIGSDTEFTTFTVALPGGFFDSRTRKFALSRLLQPFSTQVDCLSMSYRLRNERVYSTLREIKGDTSCLDWVVAVVSYEDYMDNWFIRHSSLFASSAPRYEGSDAITFTIRLR
jgi:hypothetical protein